MISILIPAYNCNVTYLVEILLNQAKRSTIPFEIIIADDGSTENFEQNRLLNSLEHCTYVRFDKNQGRTAIRNWLANEAKYSWLLFLDSDTIPADDQFYNKYISVLKTKTQYAVFLGGYTYRKSSEFNFNLRHQFGSKRESVSAALRSKNPYRYVFSGNLLIDKSVFLKCNPAQIKGYGLDLVFSGALFRERVEMLHIDNPVFHDGLEDNSTFLMKCQETATQIVEFEQQGLITVAQSRLLSTLQKVESYHMSGVLRTWLWLKIPFMRFFLKLGIAPLLWLDFYKLYYSLSKKSKLCL